MVKMGLILEKSWGYLKNLGVRCSHRADFTLGNPPKAVGDGVCSRRRRQGNVVAERSEIHLRRRIGTALRKPD